MAKTTTNKQAKSVPLEAAADDADGVAAAPDHPAAAGDRKGYAPLDALQPVRVRGQPAGDQGRCASGRSKSCLT